MNNKEKDPRYATIIDQMVWDANSVSNNDNMFCSQEMIIKAFNGFLKTIGKEIEPEELALLLSTGLVWQKELKEKQEANKVKDYKKGRREA